MSRVVIVPDLTPEQFRAFREFSKDHRHKAHAARAVFAAGIEALGLKDPKDPDRLTLEAHPVTPETLSSAESPRQSSRRASKKRTRSSASPGAAPSDSTSPAPDSGDT